MLNRRALLGSAAAGAAAALTCRPSFGASRAATSRPLPIGVSTYSFWHFAGEPVAIEYCIDQAAEMGFDGVEILHVHMEQAAEAAGGKVDNAYLQNLKRRAFTHGLDLMGFSSHQSFVKPDAEARKQNVEHTIHCIELAYELGIPTIRVNTGRWGTSGSFDELMANKGIEPNLPGYTDDQGFDWVIAAFEELVPYAEKRGVIMGLENHWGLGREASGVLRVIDAVDSPWLQATLDTGNFLENSYEQMKALAPRAVLIQAKTYHGGGEWYTLDVDYPRVASILRDAGYQGYVSLEMEGKEDPATAIPKSLVTLRAAFS